MKPYMTEDELINELVENKKIKRDTIPEGIFQERAYTSLVTPYKRLICTNFDTTNKEYIYKDNGDFQEYINYANIDEFISNKLSIYIESFEKYFKTYIAEVLASKMKLTSLNCNDYSVISGALSRLPTQDFIRNNNIDSILSENYNIQIYDFLPFDKMYTKSLKIVDIDKNIMLNRRRALDNIISLNKRNGKSPNPLIQHYFDKEETPPIWAVIHTLSLGDILAIFNMLKRKDREEITKKLLNLDYARTRQIGRLSAKINLIREIRNNINHYEPLIPTLMKFVDNNKSNGLIEIIKMLKQFHINQKIQSVKVIRRCKYSKCAITEYNRDYIKFLNNIIKEL